MRKNLLVLIVLCVALLTGCECKHQWEDATCSAPKTCSECGATEGAAKEHSWINATCITPKTCSECGATEGEVAKHKWKSATCETAKTCSVCGETSGSKSDHVYSKKVTTNEYLCSAATVESPAQYYYACKYCEQKGTKTYGDGDCALSHWGLSSYVDNFGDKTDQWFVCLRDKVEGTFCNTATTDSPLLVNVFYDCNGNISIFLYEYADEDNRVKNGSSRYDEDYEITIRDETGNSISVHGAIYPGGDRINIEGHDSNTVLNMMKTAKTMRFYIQNEDSPATTYRFDIDLTDFLYVLNIAEK